jgi:AcrR family transcriptional regulator
MNDSVETANRQPAVSTRQRLLDAAERSFVEHGYEGTTLRALAAEAGANIAAVNYHFGSKDGLLKAVVSRAMGPINAERDRRLATLEAEPDAPSIEQVVRAFVEPGLDLARYHGDRGPAVARFIGAVLLDPSPRIRQLFADHVDPVEGRYLEALGHALVDHDSATVVFAHTSMLGLLALYQVGAFTDIQWRLKPSNTPRADPRDPERLIGFLTAGLTHGLSGACQGRE